MASLNYQGISPVTRLVNDAAGVLGGRVVVSSGSANPPRQVKNPAAANAGAIEGITLWGQNRANGASVGVQTDGEALAVAAGAIAKDDKVNIADVVGRVKTVNEATSTVINQVGVALTAATAAGDVITVRLTPRRTYVA